MTRIPAGQRRKSSTPVTSATSAPSRTAPSAVIAGIQACSGIVVMALVNAVFLVGKPIEYSSRRPRTWPCSVSQSNNSWVAPAPSARISKPRRRAAGIWSMARRRTSMWSPAWLLPALPGRRLIASSSVVLMPLWMSSGDGRGCGDRVGRVDQAEGLARHEAFQAADDLTPGPALGEPTLHVGLGTGVPPQPRYDYAVQGRIGLAVAATIQPAPLRVPRRRLDRADATQSRKRGLPLHPFGIVPGHDQQRRRAIWADSDTFQQGWPDRIDEGSDPLFSAVRLAGQRDDAPGQCGQGVSARRIRSVALAELSRSLDQPLSAQA